jgi:hypothetical protein
VCVAGAVNSYASRLVTDASVVSLKFVYISAPS